MDSGKSPTSSCVSSARAQWLTVAWGVTLLALFAGTLPLWMPRAEPPRLPILPFLESAPAALDYALFATVAAGAVMAVASAPRGGPASWPISVATLALVVLLAMDQLRWQPWAYHAVVVGLALAGRSPGDAIGRLRWVAIAVYAFSALAKLDATFAQTLGQQLLLGLGDALSLPIDRLNMATRERLALLLPLWELGVAAVLAASLWRRRIALPACVLAVAMHAATIALLSPLTLGHSAGVLLWNVGFAAQTVVLFAPGRRHSRSATTPRPTATTTTTGTPRPIGWLRRPAWLAAWIATIAPVLTPFGLWDAWPGWALYAPGTERVAVFVHAAAVDRLPGSLPAYVDDASDEPSGDPITRGPWRRLRLDRWVLDATGAPLYPANRVTAGLAAWITDQTWLDGRLRLVWESPATRFTGERRSATFTDANAIRAASRLMGRRPTLE